MHDGIVFENLGVPAAPVITRPFVNMARASADANGMPEYPYGVVEHPIARLTDDELDAKADEALPLVVALLLGQSETPSTP
ncbi:MAG: hypothetical protein IT307_13770 [Chloroflexi bacterium]|nr:hypothetical protein [Chloroflexota bacterium]